MEVNELEAVGDKIMPTISVLMSIYNEPIEWIEQAINSILTQTFSDFEFIIVNDKPDRNENAVLLDKYSKKDKRIIIVNNETNLGLPKSLNKGILLAKGRYIARMDADDISLPERFARQVEFLDKHPEVGVCGTFAKKIDENNKVIGRVKLQYKSKDLKDAICFFVPFVHPTVMIRKEILQEDNYDENCIIAQDWNLWLRISDKTEFVNLRKNLLLYRISQNQSIKKAGVVKSKISRAYSDGIFADKLQLPSYISKLFLQVRNGDIDISGLNELYDYILNSHLPRDEKKYALCSYLRYLKMIGRATIWSNNVVKSYPLLFLDSVVIELKKLLKL